MITFRDFLDLTTKGLIIDSIPGELLDYSPNDKLSLTGITGNLYSVILIEVGGLDVKSMDINYYNDAKTSSNKPIATNIPAACLDNDGQFISIKIPNNNILNISQR